MQESRLEDLLKYRMPDELMQFIQRDTYSLLIKGFAGTGKTTLALTILRALESKSNFFYISTRISPKQLFQYYPWLARFIEQPEPATADEAPDRTAMPAFEDARLDEPESLFERITNQLMDIKSPIIIIDSWDAIASFMDKEARLNNERVLQTWRERAGAKLIFISEHPEDTTLDFLVDGIVELKQSYYETAKVREIFMLKLRGVRINRPSYFYTLDNSVFRGFAPYVPAKLEPRIKPAGGFELVAPSGHVRTGYPALDGSLGGGLPGRGMALLELDSHVNTAVAMAFLGRLVSNFVSTGNPVLFQPFDWIDPKTVMGYLDPYVQKKDLFKILWHAKVSGMTNVVFPDKKQAGLPLASIAQPKQKGKLLLNIMGTDVLHKIYGRDVRAAMEQVLPALRATDSLTVAVVGQTQKETLGYLVEAADIHLKLQMINGTLFLQSLVPASTLYSVVIEDRHLELEPVV